MVEAMEIFWLWKIELYNTGKVTITLGYMYNINRSSVMGCKLLSKYIYPIIDRTKTWHWVQIMSCRFVQKGFWAVHLGNTLI